MSETLARYDAGKPAVAEQYRQATDVAGVCKTIVLKTAQQIQGRKYVRVEGWESIAAAHGCVPSITSVRVEQDGIAATAELRRVDNGAVIATAEGFVGNDEKTWAGRPLYARRAMAQTRAISRVCRTAFAHVVVMMDAGLETTPAEEVPADGFEPKTQDEVNAATVTEAQIRRLYAVSTLAKNEIAAALADAFPYITDPDGSQHLLRLKRSDYGEAERIVTSGNPATDQPATQKTEATGNRHLLPLPANVTEYWPETEFAEKTEVIRGTIADVIDPVVSAKTGKPGPWKIAIKREDASVITASTFDQTLAALCQRAGARQNVVELAFVTTQNGRWTNYKLEGLR